MVNVLPPTKKRTIMLRYYRNLVMLISIVYVISFGAGAVLLIPSYLASREQADSYERYRDALEGTLGLKERGALEKDIAVLSERLRVVRDMSAGSYSRVVLESVSEVVTDDVVITGIALIPIEGGVGVTLNGRAKNRNALVAFVDVLRKSGTYVGVSLPVSQLVVEQNPPFSIQATLKTL